MGRYASRKDEMNKIDMIQFNQDHQWCITKEGTMFKVIVRQVGTSILIAQAVDDTLTTALFMAYNMSARPPPAAGNEAAEQE